MTRTATAAIWLCLLGSLGLSAQQDNAPATPAAGDAQTAPGDQAPPPTPINPKTGLPYTPAELLEKQIDRYDPMKRDVDPMDDPNRLTDRQAPGVLPNQRTGNPLPGSIAAMNQQANDYQNSQNSADPDADSAAANGAEYNGPAVLSRSYTLARPMVPRQIHWTGSLGFGFSSNSGEAPSATKGVTNYQSVTTLSTSYSWSLGGRHVWKHDQLGLTYHGSYSRYNKNGLNGDNHQVNLDYAHVLSRRLSFQFVESLQDLSQSYSLENPTLDPGNSVANLNLATSPDVQLLNSQTLQSSSSVSMTYLQTARLSYNASTSYFIIGRTEGVGMTGRQYSGDINYRWTHKATVGAYYSFTDYLYSHNISQSNSHSLGLIYSYAINRNTQLQTRFGITRIESLAYAAVPLPPALAQILGQSSVIVNAYSLRNTSDISVQLVHDFRRSRTASLAYAHGQSPGNGVLLTSVQQTITGGFSTSFLRRRVPFNLGGIYSTITSTAPGGLGFYKSETGYAGTSRSLGRGMSANFQVSYLRYNVSSSPLLEHSVRITVGFSWGPSEGLLRKL